MPTQFDLKGLRVLITGAGRGLGASAAAYLARCGAQVGVNDVDAETCAETVQRIHAAGGTALACPGDVASRDSVLGMAEGFAKEVGGLDAIVNNAMLLKYEPIEDVREDVIDRMVSIGVKGPVWGAQALLANMDPARGGAIINMASPVAEKGFPNTAVYSLVKGATVTLTKTLSAELGPRKVRVNAIAPGSVPTPGAVGLNDKAEYERRARTIPMRRLGAEADNDYAVAFLLSPEASFINGEILHVDGGIAAAG